jgi:hypothetical protein
VAKSDNPVIARYGNFFRGDDELFTHCLITKNGDCYLLGQGLEEVFLRTFKAPVEKLEKLTDSIATIPVEWSKSSYEGYNFITDPESPLGNEIAVFGVQPGGRKDGDYFVPPADSDVAKLVKSIANIDAVG